MENTIKNDKMISGIYIVGKETFVSYYDNYDLYILWIMIDINR